MTHTTTSRLLAALVLAFTALVAEAEFKDPLATPAVRTERLTQAPDDANFALEYVKRNARTPEAQMAALDALRFKCNVLWAQLDALHYAYVEPGLIPPGAFVPGKA